MQRIRGTTHGVPDLAVEVVSESETAVDLDRKVQQYLKAGTAAVWAVYTETRHIMGYRRFREARMVVLGQRLEEPELLPGWIGSFRGGALVWDCCVRVWCAPSKRPRSPVSGRS